MMSASHAEPQEYSDIPPGLARVLDSWEFTACRLSRRSKMEHWRREQAGYALNYHLSEIPVESLAEENRACLVCMETMGKASKHNKAERAVHLPLCGKHACGNRCLVEWLQDHSTCPVCRQNYPKDICELFAAVFPKSWLKYFLT